MANVEVCDFAENRTLCSQMIADYCTELPRDARFRLYINLDEQSSHMLVYLVLFLSLHEMREGNL